MASRSWQVNDFLNYLPRLASDILGVEKWKKEKKFKIASPHSHDSVAFQKLI